MIALVSRVVVRGVNARCSRMFVASCDKGLFMHRGQAQCSQCRSGAGARLRCIIAVTPIRFTAYHTISFTLMSLYDVLNMGVPRHSALLYAN